MIRGVRPDAMNYDTPAQAENRHQRFLKSVVESGTVWTLQNEAGIANWSDEEAEEPIVPLWSDRDAAGDCASACFPGYQPESISLDTLLATLLPQLEDRGLWVGSNLTSEMAGIDMSARELRQCLEKIMAESGSRSD